MNERTHPNKTTKIIQHINWACPRTDPVQLKKEIKE